MKRIIPALLIFSLGLIPGLVVSEVTDPEVEKAAAVTVKSAKELLFYPLKKAPARVLSLQNSVLSAEIDGVIESIEIKIGDRVEQGQSLIRLDCEDFTYQKQELQAERQSLLAKKQFSDYQYERSSRLLKTKNIAEETHRLYASERKSLKAQIELIAVKIKKADKQISRCNILAPFSGVVVERLVNIGESVSPQTPLLRLLDPNDLEVSVQVPIDMVGRFNHKHLNFVFAGQSYPLKHRVTVPSVQTRARHQEARLVFIGDKPLPDAFGELHVTLAESYLPAHVFVQREGKMGVFVLADDKAKFFAFEQGLTGRPVKYIPSETFAESTRIIVSGRQNLIDGQYVRVTEDLQ